MFLSLFKQPIESQQTRSNQNPIRAVSAITQVSPSVANILEIEADPNKIRERHVERRRQLHWTQADVANRLNIIIEACKPQRGMIHKGEDPEAYYAPPEAVLTLLNETIIHAKEVAKQQNLFDIFSLELVGEELLTLQKTKLTDCRKEYIERLNTTSMKFYTALSNFDKAYALLRFMDNCRVKIAKEKIEEFFTRQALALISLRTGEDAAATPQVEAENAAGALVRLYNSTKLWS